MWRAAVSILFYLQDQSASDSPTPVLSAIRVYAIWNRAWFPALPIAALMTVYITIAIVRALHAMRCRRT